MQEGLYRPNQQHQLIGQPIVGDGTADPADGFSVNYARAEDPVVTQHDGNGWASSPGNEANLPEEGTQTGIGIGFDAWNSGSGDIIGISVRVDNILLTQIPMPTKNGAATDATSMQTGPRTSGTGVGDQLTWQPLKIEVKDDAKVNIWWKNVQVVTNLQTTYFPSAGRIVFGGRTGGSWQYTAVDNISIQTFGKATATVTLGALSHIYDGTTKSATATTAPAGLTVGFTYNGSPNAPIDADSYTVVGTVNDPNYQGSATGTLIIGKASATVTLGNLSHTYDGTAKSAVASTTPVGLMVGFTYNGSPNAPIDAGSYTIVGTINDPNYQGSTTGTLVIGKDTATNSPPFIVTNPTNLQTFLGDSAMFSVLADGSMPLTYQWYHDGFAISGATNTGLTLLAASDSDSGWYAVMVSNQFGWVMSQAAECVVQTPPVLVSQTASPVRLKAGETLKLTVEASGSAPLSYAWYFNGTSIAGAAASNWVIANIQPPQQGPYYAVVSNGVGAVTSAVVSVSVIVPPGIASKPLSQHITLEQMAQGVMITVGVNGTGPFAYQWQLNGQAIPGATNDSLTLQPVRLADAGTYTVVVENEAGTVVSDPAELVIETPVILAGDDLTNRVNLPLVMTNVIAGSNTLATVEPGEPAHGSKPTSHTVWYGWTAPGTGWVEFRTRGSSFDTVLAAYGIPSGALTNAPFNFELLQPLAADDDSDGYVERSGAGYVDEGTYFSSRIVFNVRGGEEYAVVVASFGEAAGRYLMEWEYHGSAVGLPELISQAGGPDGA